MENLEEVLQALDEFQKMRPTEIPRELEEYLCWVAKTGDPVYQWPMIKTLFREKLTRVMTDFYESCPTLELAPCPNVEHFNYDTMKSNLLERLESFANAPFTVQRICELLTAPRKEYNRVDKFMRAIEKNILVVSTREPGPIARRGETGDGMVNGSVEEDTVTQQQPPPPSPPPSPSPSPQTTQSTAQSAQQPSTPAAQDVEMEYWEKDCASTVTISVHTVENEATSLLHTVVPGAAANSTSGSALAKNAAFSTADEAAREKLEQSVVSRSEQLTTSNFIGATSDFSAISNLTSQVEQSHEQPVAPVAAAPVVQNLTTPVEAIVAEDSSLESADVADTIMNEDTSSQASLDMENDEVDPTIAATTTATTTTATTTTATATATTTATATRTTSSSTTSASTTSASSSSSTSSSSATTTVTVVATVIPLTTDTTRNLQAAFQAKRFEDADDKRSDKPNEKTTASAAVDEPGLIHSKKNDEAAETSTECGSVNGMPQLDESKLTENLLKAEVLRIVTDDYETDGVADEERLPSKAEEQQVESSPRLSDVEEEKSRCPDDESTKTPQVVFVEAEVTEKDNSSDECASAVIVSSGEALHRTEKAQLQPKGTYATTAASWSSKDSRLVHEQTTSRKADSMDVVADQDQVLESIPRLTSSRGDEQTGPELHNAEFNGDGMKMMEIANDKVVESMVVEPARVTVENVAREAGATVIEKFDSTASPVVEMRDGTVVCPCPQDDALMRATEEDDATSAQLKAKSSVIENAACRREAHDQVEMMEVDDEESASSTFQQEQQQLDEQMEHETMEELSKS